MIITVAIVDLKILRGSREEHCYHRSETIGYLVFEKPNNGPHYSLSTSVSVVWMAELIDLLFSPAFNERDGLVIDCRWGLRFAFLLLGCRRLFLKHYILETELCWYLDLGLYEFDSSFCVWGFGSVQMQNEVIPPGFDVILLGYCLLFLARLAREVFNLNFCKGSVETTWNGCRPALTVHVQLQAVG